METSQTHGTSSLAPPRDESEVRARARALLTDPDVSRLLNALGADAACCLVGGTVREFVLGLSPADLDIASKLSPDEVRERAASAGIRIVDTGPQHGTVTAVLSERSVEITTFRKPGPREPRGDTIGFADSIEEDLFGRDLTINAMAIEVGTLRLIDPTGGYSDLLRGIARAVGDPAERFTEDPHRILRLVRFGPASGRGVDGPTEHAAKELCASLHQVSPERILAELKRILTADHPANGLRAMRAWGILLELFPELLPMDRLPQNEFHSQDVFEHTMSVIERCPRDAGLRLAALFHDSGKPATLSTGSDGRRHFYEHEILSARIGRQIMERLRCSNEEIARVSTIVRHHMRPIQCGPAGVRRILRDAAEFYADWRTFKYADAPPVYSEEQVRQELEMFDRMVKAEEVRRAAQGSRLAISGNDLIEIGFVPGVALGRFLKECEELVIESPELNTKEELLARARHALSQNLGS
jgi:tRNA nucleotidyltransferase (CCA-adding enzyme)